MSTANADEVNVSAINKWIRPRVVGNRWCASDFWRFDKTIFDPVKDIKFAKARRFRRHARRVRYPEFVGVSADAGLSAGCSSAAGGAGLGATGRCRVLNYWTFRRSFRLRRPK